MPAPKQWHKAFVTLPPEWRVLTYFQRSLMQDYWRLSDADCSGRIEVAGDPVKFLVRLLDLSSKGDRSAAVRETQKLMNLGLLVHTQEPGSVGHVAVRTAVLRPRSSDVPATFDTQLPTSVPNDAGTTQPNNPKSLTTGQTDREKEESREIVAKPLRRVVSAEAESGMQWYAALIGQFREAIPSFASNVQHYEFFGAQSQEDRDTVAKNLRESRAHGAKLKALSPKFIAESLWQSHLLSEQEHAARKAQYGKQTQPAAAPVPAAHKLMQF